MFTFLKNAFFPPKNVKLHFDWHVFGYDIKQAKDIFQQHG
jgi:hypothetical protein